MNESVGIDVNVRVQKQGATAASALGDEARSARDTLGPAAQTAAGASTGGTPVPGSIRGLLRELQNSERLFGALNVQLERLVKSTTAFRPDAKAEETAAGKTGGSGGGGGDDTRTSGRREPRDRFERMAREVLVGTLGAAGISLGIGAATSELRNWVTGAHGFARDLTIDSLGMGGGMDTYRRFDQDLTKLRGPAFTSFVGPDESLRIASRLGRQGLLTSPQDSSLIGEYGIRAYGSPGGGGEAAGQMFGVTRFREMPEYLATIAKEAAASHRTMGEMLEQNRALVQLLGRSEGTYARTREQMEGIVDLQRMLQALPGDIGRGPAGAELAQNLIQPASNPLDLAFEIKAYMRDTGNGYPTGPEGLLKLHKWQRSKRKPAAYAEEVRGELGPTVGALWLERSRGIAPEVGERLMSKEGPYAPEDFTTLATHEEARKQIDQENRVFGREPGPRSFQRDLDVQRMRDQWGGGEVDGYKIPGIADVASWAKGQLAHHPVRSVVGMGAGGVGVSYGAWRAGQAARRLSRWLRGAKAATAGAGEAAAETAGAAGVAGLTMRSLLRRAPMIGGAIEAGSDIYGAAEGDQNSWYDIAGGLAVGGVAAVGAGLASGGTAALPAGLAGYGVGSGLSKGSRALFGWGSKPKPKSWEGWNSTTAGESGVEPKPRSWEGWNFTTAGQSGVAEPTTASVAEAAWTSGAVAEHLSLLRMIAESVSSGRITSEARASGASGSRISPNDPIFRRTAAKYGLPQGLLPAIAGVESDFNPNAVSPTGVRGLMQITKETGRPYGLTDANRMDPAKQVDVAGHYMKDLLERRRGDLRSALSDYGGESLWHNRYADRVMERMPERASARDEHSRPVQVELLVRAEGDFPVSLRPISAHKGGVFVREAE